MKTKLVMSYETPKNYGDKDTLSDRAQSYSN